MTDHVVRTLTDDELRASQDLFRATLHVKPLTDDQWPSVRASLQPARSLGVHEVDSGALIGTARSFDSAITVPGGGDVPLGAVTSVGVRADCTRRGVLTELMHAQLREFADRGLVAAGLHASESAIYGRFGYGIATRARDYTVDVRRAKVRQDAPAGGRVNIENLDSAMERWAAAYPAMATRPGMLARPDEWWAGLRSHLAREEGPVTAVTHEGTGGVDGFAVYSVDRPRPGSATLNLIEMQAAGPEAFCGVWRYLLSVDLVHEVTASVRPLDDPLELLLTDPRAVSTTGQFDDLWVRLVDVPAALAMRTYDGEPVVLEVTDPVLPGNEGCYRLGPDGAVRTDQPAELQLSVDTLAMIHLGAWRPSQLVDTGRVRETAPGAAERADRLLSTATPPWCGTFF
ncbi:MULTISPECIES: GNAT family N-acetyltransferase [Prauserella salsuginis group]|uniref:GNAT family N-acetyltransferase n=1 Tax=Prauserella salsuginis TaxID=387889 RepID=A0ABW6G4A9_9PSEU|nr:MULTISPECIES: GNAT family N-acetyltransferase [Prauserella salsuginis group]